MFHQSPPTSLSQLLCFICQDLFVRPHTAFCGHTFCHLCLDEYLIYSEVCPKCSASIRGKPLSPVPCMAEFIENAVIKDKRELERLRARGEKAKGHLRQRQLRGVKVGSVIDIRDSNSIWCEGMVVRIVARLEEPSRLVRVTYLNYLEKEEEDVAVDSERLAAKGFYTGRNDIPHYGRKPTSFIITKDQI